MTFCEEEVSRAHGLIRWLEGAPGTVHALESTAGWHVMERGGEDECYIRLLHEALPISGVRLIKGVGF